MAKIAEKIILKSLREYITDNHILPDQQFGFRPGHCAEHQVARVVTDAMNAFNTRSNHTAMILVDLEKAFDRVWTAGLLHKLIASGCPPALTIIASSLQERSFRVRVNEELSAPIEVTAGVPQWSVLGPVLFSIYTADIPCLPMCKVALYANDTLLYTHAFSQIVAISKLKIYLQIFEKYLTKWKVTATPQKSTVAILTKRTNHVHIPQLPKFFNTPIPCSNTLKYLGVHIDKHTTFKGMSVNNTHKAIAITNAHRYLLLHRGLSLEVKILLYKRMIRPVLLYGAPIWANAARRHINRLQAQQNKCLRIILGADIRTPIRKLHEQTGLPLVREFVMNTASKFYQKTTTHENPLIRDITRTRLVEERHKMPYHQLEVFRTPRD